MTVIKDSIFVRKSRIFFSCLLMLWLARFNASNQLWDFTFRLLIFLLNLISLRPSLLQSPPVVFLSFLQTICLILSGLRLYLDSGMALINKWTTLSTPSATRKPIFPEVAFGPSSQILRCQRRRTDEEKEVCRIFSRIQTKDCLLFSPN